MLGFVFSVALAAAVATNYLDWHKTDELIHKNGLAGEKNPIMRFFFSKSKWAALAYKAWPIGLLGFAWAHYQNGEYVNETTWAYVWIAGALLSAAAGLYGFLKSK